MSTYSGNLSVVCYSTEGEYLSGEWHPKKTNNSQKDFTVECEYCGSYSYFHKNEGQCKSCGAKLKKSETFITYLA